MSEKTSLWKRLSDWVAGEERPNRPKNPKPRRKRARIEIETQDAHEVEHFLLAYRIVAVAVCVSIVGILLYTVFRLPLFGADGNPASNEVVTRYVEKGLEETGSVNIVTGMILDYRAFDTFGESSVLFLAVSSVLILLLRDKNNISAEEDVATAHEKDIERALADPILQKIVEVLVPFIFLFGVYVVLNGHLSPGGGFSGGAIMGAGLIVLAASRGVEQVQKFFTMKTFRAITSTALLTYASCKAYSFFMGANGLETGIPLGVPGAILSSGLIFVLDICVGCVVCCTMYGFYALFARGEI